MYLIDYFHDLRIVQEGDSINFQKASCTLDGCVKIFSSRVDSVAVETDKLLGDLVTSEMEEKKKRRKEEESTNNKMTGHDSMIETEEREEGGIDDNEHTSKVNDI